MKQKFLLVLAIVTTTVIGSAFIPNTNSNGHRVSVKSSGLEGKFVLTTFRYYGKDFLKDFNGYAFDFIKTGGVSVTFDAGGSKGSWSLSDDNRIYFEFPDEAPLNMLNGKWDIKEQNEEYTLLVNDDNSEAEFRYAN